jgi:hypothetical protein
MLRSIDSFRSGTLDVPLVVDWEQGDAGRVASSSLSVTGSVCWTFVIFDRYSRVTQ